MNIYALKHITFQFIRILNKFIQLVNALITKMFSLKFVRQLDFHQ